MSNFEKETVDKIIECFIQGGVINEHSVRNWKIYKRYCQLNYEEKLRSSDAFEQISKEFPPITASGIQKIVYRMKKENESIGFKSSGVQFTNDKDK